MPPREGFFDAHGRSRKHERVVDRFLRETGTARRCAPRERVDVNHESGLVKARRVARPMAGPSPAAAP